MALTQLESYMVGPTASTSKITSLTYPSSATAANPIGGETVTITGSGFSAGATVYVDTTSCATTYVSATSLTFTAPAKSLGSYHLYVYNTDGSFAIKPGGFISSSLPTWVTASGALTGGSQNAVYSSSVSATGDGTITYAVTTGSLPTGLNLNSSTGAITGTPTVIVTSTFSITATDSQNQIVARSFSIAIANVVSAVEYLVVGGGGGGGTQSGGGGGAGGYRTDTGFAVTSGTPITVTVGGGGAGTVVGGNGDRPAGTTGSPSVFSTITSLGGGGGGCYRGGVGLAGNSGGSGGGGGVGGSAGAAGGSGTAGQGFDGGIGGPDNSSNQDVGGGGGGAGAIGVSYNDANTAIRGDGGAGSTSSISGTSVTYAGGGGGGTYGGPRAGSGGTGGGGAGGNSTGSVTASNGNPNTGGGGGGGWEFNNAGGTGGSGVVIIRYADTYIAASATTNLEAGYPVVSGGYRIYKWITSGTITF